MVTWSRDDHVSLDLGSRSGQGALGTQTGANKRWLPGGHNTAVTQVSGPDQGVDSFLPRWQAVKQPRPKKIFQKKVENTQKKLKIKKKQLKIRKKKVENCPKKGVKSKENWIFTTFLQQNTTFL